MKETTRRDSTDSTASSPLMRPTIDAVVLLLTLPIILLVVVLVPWSDVGLSSPHLQLLGIVLTFASVLICLKMACAACPRSTENLSEDEWRSRRNSRVRLLSVTQELPPNYESIMTSGLPGQNAVAQWVVTLQPPCLQPHQHPCCRQSTPEPQAPVTEPPPYHTVVVEETTPPPPASEQHLSESR